MILIANIATSQKDKFPQADLWKQILCNYFYGWKKKQQSWGGFFFVLFSLVGWLLTCLFFVALFFSGFFFFLRIFSTYLPWFLLLSLSLRRARNPIILQPHDLYETQIKVLCFYSTHLLTGKVLLEVHFKDSLLLSQLFLPFPRTLCISPVRQESCGKYSSVKGSLKIASGQNA